MKINHTFLVSSLCFVLLNCTTKSTDSNNPWKNLFNGNDLVGWDTYLGPAYDTIQNKRDTLNVPGLNNDPNKVFSILTIDNAPAIRISGAHDG